MNLHLLSIRTWLALTWVLLAIIAFAPHGLLAAEGTTATIGQPNQEDARTLFSRWQANSRTDGKIPGALIGMLGEKVKYFISLNKDDESGHDYAVKFETLLPRFEATHDWSPADAIVLLDKVSAIHPIPLINTLDADSEHAMLGGEPLPPELADAPWGSPSAEGLRAAWLLEPREHEYRLGTSLKSRILLHNAGKRTVLFIMPSWQQSGEHTAVDHNDAAIKVTSTYWTTRARKLTYRLAPGEYCETPAAGVGVGAMTEEEDWANARPGAWIEAQPGDEVRLSPAAVEVRYSPKVVGTMIMDGRPLNVDPKDAADLWKRIITERVGRELPLPTDASERTHTIDRVTVDLFGEPPTPQEVAAFIADDQDRATENLIQRLSDRPSVVPFTGTLRPGVIELRVLPIDPDAADYPRVATGPGYYILGDQQRLAVEAIRRDDRLTNSATIRFFAAAGESDPPGKPFSIPLPDGVRSYAIAWDRDTGNLWIAQQGLVRNYDFSNPAEVKETRFDPGVIGNAPERFRQSLRHALDVEDVSLQ